MTENEKDKIVKGIYEHQFSQWDFANNVIYNVCREYPLHKKADEIVAKVWIIGRTYAASIERTSSKRVHYFGEGSVAEVLLHHGDKLDQMISEVKNQALCEDTVVSCIKLHGYLMELFQEISGMNKRSLASKYLHFHLKNLFYIYDSNSSKSCNQLIRQTHIDYKPVYHRIVKQLENSGQFFDYEYLKFYVEMLCIQNELMISDAAIVNNFPRIIDNLLLGN